MSAGAKAVNYLSMLLGGAVGVGVGLIIYRRTMARAAELARDASDDDAAAEEGAAGYQDTDSTLMDPEDAARLMSDDDISMWENDTPAYHDDDTDGSDGRASKKLDSDGVGDRRNS